MAGSKTDVGEIEVLKMMTGQALAITLPITPYIALFTVAPTDAGGGTEVSGSGYSRQSSAGKWAAPAAGATALNANVDFPTVTGSSYTVVAIACLDASSGGNMLWWADAGSVLVAVGNFYRLPATTGITFTES